MRPTPDREPREPGTVSRADSLADETRKKSLGAVPGILAGVIAAAAGLGLVLVEGSGILPPGENAPTPIGLWVISASCIAFLVVQEVVAIRTLNAALERTRAELVHRKESEEKYRLMIENSHDLISRTDGEGRFLFVSRQHELVLGYRPEELIGTHPIDLVHPEDAAAAIPEWARMPVPGRTVVTLRIRHKDGGWRWFECSSSAYRTARGEVRNAIFARDITERKLAEERLLQSLREKETLVQELYHRTKNTIQIVRSLLLLRASDCPDNAELQALAASTDARIQAIALVQQTLYDGQDLSRISVRAYVEALFALMLEGTKAPARRFSLDAEIDDSTILIDTAVPFGLILHELLTNSAKFAFPGGREGRISIRLGKAASGLSLLSYADDGIGFPEGFDCRKTKTMGMRLILGLGEQQMQGKVTIDGAAGFRCVLEFPDDLYDARI